jgi:pyocin large subunit-like protein
MLQFTGGFVSAYQLADHFQRHGRDFGLQDEDAYESAADTFLGGPRGQNVHECVIPGNGAKAGRMMRYDEVTEEFGVLTPDGHILTYYRPAPITGTKLQYFQRQCAKR